MCALDVASAGYNVLDIKFQRYVLSLHKLLCMVQ